jgi:hypothetical protein
MLDAIFANLATGFSQQFGAPFVDAVATWPGAPVTDDGGSIVTPGTPVLRTCKAQVSAPTEAMRADVGFVATDMRIHVLAATLDGTLDTEAQISIATGPHAGTWALHSVTRDTAGIGWTCRGRRV